MSDPRNLTQGIPAKMDNLAIPAGLEGRAMTELSWVQKAGRNQIKKKAQAIYNAFDEATDRLDIKDGEALRFVLMEVINQLQESPGIIQASTLYLVAQCIAELGGRND